jgi:hypothetical protein
LLRAAFLGVAGATALLVAGPSAHAQQRLSKVPLADKVIPTGPTHQAFTGKVESLDEKLHVLNVNSVKGDSVEIFPLKKNTKVAMASGRPLALAAILPGMEVIVYYEQKGGRRAVENIVVLEPKEKAKKSPPPS